MAGRDEIVDFCDRLLEIESWEDYGPNGLQVPGAAEVSKVVSGVSAHLELLEQAVGAGAQLVLVHHGLFWGSGSQALSEQLAGRLRVALGADLSVAAYHLPLDAHREIGNNALLAGGLGLRPDQSPFAEVNGRPIGVVGHAPEPVSIDELVRSVSDLVGREPLVFDSGPELVRSVGICSGGASRQVHDAIAIGLDAFITGEPAESAMADAREGGLHFIAAGHYATETFGIRRLGELVGERFGVDHEFVDIPNPV